MMPPFIANHKLDHRKYSVFISRYRILKKGVIKDIPPEYSEAEIKEMISCDYEVFEVKRMHKFDRIQKVVYPLSLVTITFVSNSLPKMVKMD